MIKTRSPLKPTTIKALSNSGMGIMSGQKKTLLQPLVTTPDYVPAYTNLAGAKIGLGHYEAVIENFDEALDLEELNDAPAYTRQGDAKRLLGDYEEAIADYDEALRIDPYFAPAYNGRGLAKNLLDQYESAIEDYTHALGIDPNYVLAYDNRGAAKDELGQYESAIEDYNEALRLNPNYVRACDASGHGKAIPPVLDEGKVYFDRGLPRLSDEQYEAAIEACDADVDQNR